MRRRRYEVTEMYALIEISNQMLDSSFRSVIGFRSSLKGESRFWVCSLDTTKGRLPSSPSRVSDGTFHQAR